MILKTRTKVKGKDSNVGIFAGAKVIVYGTHEGVVINIQKWNSLLVNIPKYNLRLSVNLEDMDYDDKM